MSCCRLVICKDSSLDCSTTSYQSANLRVRKGFPGGTGVGFARKAWRPRRGHEKEVPHPKWQSRRNWWHWMSVARHSFEIALGLCRHFRKGLFGERLARFTTMEPQKLPNEKLTKNQLSTPFGIFPSAYSLFSTWQAVCHKSRLMLGPWQWREARSSREAQVSRNGGFRFIPRTTNIYVQDLSAQFQDIAYHKSTTKLCAHAAFDRPAVLHAFWQITIQEMVSPSRYQQSPLASPTKISSFLPSPLGTDPVLWPVAHVDGDESHIQKGTIRQMEVASSPVNLLARTSEVIPSRQDWQTREQLRKKKEQAPLSQRLS